VLTGGAILIVDENFALFAPGNEAPVSRNLVNVDAKEDFDLLHRFGGHAVRTNLHSASIGYQRLMEGSVQVNKQPISIRFSGFIALEW
jgi:hypothetical protein